MTNLVIATAGHVDHGKSTLIKALTGIETDTTKEEKMRGLSINLGFAYLDLPNGQRVGIVDVPGHERFIKNMVAGLPGISLVLLVIDAGEGVMPQTKEHIDILTLLGIQDFFLVLTKVDTVDDEMKALVIADIREQLANTPLADAELIETDAVSGKGLDLLKKKIQDWAETRPEQAKKGDARLNVDRVFSIKGFGTVVTGTLLDGSVRIGDELTVYPGGKKTRIRNIQVHEQNVVQADAPHRTALNLANVSVEEIHRGDVLSKVPFLQPTWMIDAKIQCLRSAPTAMELWDRVRLLVGTREIMARIVPLGVDQIEPGCDGFMQLRLEEAIVIKEGDRFILRTYSPIFTIGGGEVLDAAPKKHRRFKEDVLESLKIKEEGNLEDIVADFLRNSCDVFTPASKIAAYLGLAEEHIQAIVQHLRQEKIIEETALGYIHSEVYKKMRGQTLQFLLSYHQRYPLRKGMAIEELRSRMRNLLHINPKYRDIQTEDSRSRMRKLLSDRVISLFLQLMIEHQYCRLEGSYVAAAKFYVVFSEIQLAVKKSIETTLEKSGFTPLKVEDLSSLAKDADAVLEALRGDSVIFLTPEYVIAKSVYDQAVKKIIDYIGEYGKMTLGDFRDITKSSRKSSMLILEYADAGEVTKRVENYRVLGKKGVK
ncbi:selenocysteine-specific translation elongation factor [Megasphaera butyrica]|uniref:selenocysteine-specific translation elongation factor n=1 Tax=Megasphaera butyrica TaxID=2981791 RepID=UPI000821EB29|nr:selenocysteine-specific translation elongation factor [Megasphaera butyrica]MCU6715351.1 selenocysteine-specific translation elongation factor [Megasphaera butyrica]SCI04889.1 SelB translation factor [uncultured Megasphaera sp.]SCJ54611.1 SelB translation factor [uncultured Ruminococcus sp.]